MTTRLTSWCFAVCGLALVSCSQSSPEQPAPVAKTEPVVQAPPPAAAPAMDPKQLFTTRCATCHGEKGHGDGPASAALNPKPRNYTDATWQKSVTDEQIKKTILYGGAAVGKSPIMPASPDLESQPAVLDGLVKIVRSFGES